MDNFIVSARKYRPDNFRSVVGQSSITSTLKNAIKNNHLGHAYLFSGPRGVGKTTCARIFAKTINCMNLPENTEACNTCESCKSFNESRAFNIHELDAASNNSVDDIRSLTEQVRIPPQVGKYSVYIIDEVHMLSQQAFNAFLKTLEEPPAHAVFILATTEKHKIIPTILSRCQIYDFNRIKTEDSVEYLKYIAGEEGISYEEDALHIIAQKAEGAMRDALSIFDQVVSFSEKKITYAYVIDNLNILDLEYYFKMTEAFLDNNISDSLLSYNEILEKGFDARNFISGLASHFRDLLVSKDATTISLLDLGTKIKDKYLQQAAKIPVEFIYEALEICNDTDLQFRNSRNQRLTIELALVKLSNLSMVQKKKIDDAKADASTAEAGPSVIQPKKVEAPATESMDEASARTAKIEEEGTVPDADNVEVSDDASDNLVENQVVHTKSISIKGVLKGASREIPVADAEINEDDVVAELEKDLEKEVEITESDLQTAWQDFAASIEKAHPRIYSTLKQYGPTMKSSGKIKIELGSNAQRENFIHKIKPMLTKYLQTHLANIEYDFDAGLISNGEVGKKVYTDHDKLDYMMKKNADLENLKNTFNLDFDN